jgi:hemerythrin-like domain-containing protein
MAIVHNILIRSLNAIYLQVDSVAARAQRPEAEQDVRDFLTYCQCWCDTIKHHHHAEEEIYFPAIEAFADQKGVMDENVDGHLAFSAGLEEFTRYVYNAEANLDLFGAGEVKRLIDGFAPAFMAHMHDEIPTLLGLKKYGSEDAARAMQQACEARIVGSLDKVRQYTMLIRLLVLMI